MKKVSVVVPVYNKQPYLKESLESLLSDSSENIEFLLIDDASTDGSLSILENASKNDSRVRILKNSSNLGVSSTRNRGICEAKGEYIGFFDADDIVSSGFYQTLYQTATHYRKRPDMVVGNLTIYGGLSTYLLGKQSYTNTQVEIPNVLQPYLPFSLQRHQFFTKEVPSCCNKIYHRNFLKERRFPDYIKEDVYFHSWVSHDAKRVVEDRSVNYYYCVNHSERDNSAFKHPCGDFIELIDAYYWSLLKIGDSPLLVDALKKFQCQILESFLHQCVCWEIPYPEKVKLIGTVYDYCVHLDPEFQSTTTDLSLKIIEMYQQYLVANQNPTDDIRKIEKRLSVLSKIYPRCRS